MIRSTFDGFDKTYRGEELAQLMRKLKRKERQMQQIGESVLPNEQPTDNLLSRVWGWLKSQLGLGDVSHQDWGDSSEVQQEIEQKYALLIPLAVEDLFLKHRKIHSGAQLRYASASTAEFGADSPFRTVVRSRIECDYTPGLQNVCVTLQ